LRSCKGEPDEVLAWGTLRSLNQKPALSTAAKLGQPPKHPEELRISCAATKFCTEFADIPVRGIPK